jgi:archaemetzincin
VTQKLLRLILLDEVDARIMERVVQEVGRVLGLRISLETSLHCEDGFDATRKQWRAETLLQRCVEPYTSPDCLAVGLTSRDLYVPSLNFVFGLAIREAGVAIVSWHRLVGDEEILIGRITKEVVHEVGHIQGLDHCRNDLCVMWFSNTLSETDAKKAEFCPACKVRRA